MSTFTTRVEGADRFLFDWHDTTRKAASTLIPLVLHELKAKAPVKTGRFKDSIGFRVESGPGVVKIKFVSTAPYASYVLEGTDGGTEITPVKTIALRFTGADGQYAFAKSVIRGATPANEFNKEVAERIKPIILSTFAESFVVLHTK